MNLESHILELANGLVIWEGQVPKAWSVSQWTVRKSFRKSQSTMRVETAWLGSTIHPIWSWQSTLQICVPGVEVQVSQVRKQFRITSVLRAWTWENTWIESSRIKKWQHLTQMRRINCMKNSRLWTKRTNVLQLKTNQSVSKCSKRRWKILRAHKASIFCQIWLLIRWLKDRHTMVCTSSQISWGLLH